MSLAAVIAFADSDRRLRICAIVALLCLVGAQVLFWVFTYPANAATANWKVQPDNWEALRLQWEYSHAGGAVLQLVAMASLIIGALGDNRPRL